MFVSASCFELSGGGKGEGGRGKGEGGNGMGREGREGEGREGKQLTNVLWNCPNLTIIVYKTAYSLLQLPLCMSVFKFRN